MSDSATWSHNIVADHPSSNMCHQRLKSPLVQKLSYEEQIKLARKTLKAAADADIYKAKPPTSDEFGADTSGLAWDAEGWEVFDASR